MSTENTNEEVTGIKSIQDKTITITNVEKFTEHLKRIAEKSRNKEAVVKKELYNFQYNFTEEELKDKSRQLAKSCEERNRLEDEKKSVMGAFKAKIDSKSEEINVISNHINSGYEWLSKSCDVVMDFDNGIKTYFYEGLKVGEEKMMKADYQITIDDVEKIEA